MKVPFLFLHFIFIHIQQKNNVFLYNIINFIITIFIFKFCIFLHIFLILVLGGKSLMNLSIREHIINNFKGDDYDTLRRAIDESVASQDEVTLPGLGVFLEIIWENADQELKNQLIDIIKKRVEKGLEKEKRKN